MTAAPRDLDPLFTAGPYACHAMQRAQVDELQAFFDANPEYFLTVGDAPPSPTEAQAEFDHRPPAEWPIGSMWVLKFTGPDGHIVAKASVVSDLIASHVWHVGLFIVATAHHGRGTADVLYAALEDWMRKHGATWIRLAVVVGNSRAERFWERCGYAEVRQRNGVALGRRITAVRMMVKGLGGGSLEDYLMLIARDRPQAP